MVIQKRIPKTFCTTREAADILGVSLRTAQLWTENGLLEAWKTDGGHRRISRQSIERLLANPASQRSPNERAGDNEAAALTAASPLSILVVEDDTSLRRLYEIKLGGWPMKPNISTAADGYEALIRMGDCKPDLLIADLQMPGMDGFRMLRTVSTVPELAGMTIVVVSGLDPEDISRRGGVPDGMPVLPKPVPFDRLLAIAEKVAAERLNNASRTSA